MNNIIQLNQESHPKNRRVYSRMPCALGFFNDEKDPFDAKDISIGGVRLVSRKKLTNGSVVPLSVKSNNSGSFFNLDGQVVWEKEDANPFQPWEYGIKFIDSSSEDQKILKHIVYRLNQGDSSNDETLFLPLALVRDQNDLGGIVEKVKKQVLNDLILASAKKCSSISSRPLELWQWCNEGIAQMTLSSVGSQWRLHAQLIKLLSVLFFTTIDDIADELKDKNLLQAILKKISGQSFYETNSLPKEASKRIRRVMEIWEFIKNYIRTLPRYEQLREIFFFDCSNLFRGIEYAMLINNNPLLINETEGLYHQAYEVHVMPNMTIDLMCSEESVMKELGKLREIGWYAQNMCRIANWISTWRRELSRRDYTSGVVSMAVKLDIVKREELVESSPENLIRKIEQSDVEDRLLKQWGKCWTQIQKCEDLVGSVDVKYYLKGAEYFFKMQVACDSLIYDSSPPSNRLIN